MVAVSRFPVPRLAELPDDIRARIEAVQEKSGFVPNVFLTLAHRPAEFRAFFAYHDALMERDGGLSPAEREMIVVATSAVNDCLYCVIAHGAVLRIRAKDPLLADYLAIDYRRADLTPRQRAIIEFAVKLAGAPQTVEEADLDRLRDHGLDEDDVWDVGAITALFALSNRMAQVTGMAPNEEFHLMGRLPRG
ncbi:MAG TPA: peroxidase-related enzyme [Mycobacteriales bacterium]